MVPKLYFPGRKNPGIKRTVMLVIACFVYVSNITGQHSPLNPVSGRVFTPFVFNPAIAGSKDFATIDFSGVIQGDNLSQLLSGNTRLSKLLPAYYSSPTQKTFTNIGVGGAVYNDNLGTSHSRGLLASASYHQPVDKTGLSFISFGASFKATYNTLDSIPDLSQPGKNTFIPNIDLGLYYYSPSLFIGVSATNMLGNRLDSAEASIFTIPVSKQYTLHAGYKFLVSRELNIVIEPSVVINYSDSLSLEYSELIEPMLKIYMDNFCFGSFMHDYDNLSFFFQYRFPKIYLGAFVDFPRNTAFYKKDLMVELSVGLNLSGLKPASFRNWHW